MRSRTVTPIWAGWLRAQAKDGTETVTQVREERLTEIRNGGTWRTTHAGRGTHTKEINRGLFAIIRYLGDSTNPDTTTIKDYIQKHPPTIL